MSTAEKLNAIKTREDFVSFVYEMSKDYRVNPRSWENKDLGAFLEALAAWVEDMDGYYLNHGQPVPEKPDWKNVADMLMAAKLYE
jgi:hypothetical protein